MEPTVEQPVTWLTRFETWAIVVGVLMGGWLVLGSLWASLTRRSIAQGFSVTFGRAAGVAGDLFGLSPRRVWALTWHCVIESVRRKVLLVFCVFGVLFLFGGWYLNARPTEQVKMYVSFVLMSATLITMVAAVLLAALSLPTDIKQQTIHTVSTKPVRRLEIVLGRVIGFSAVAAVILTIMGAISYVYLQRSVRNSIAQLDELIAEARQAGDSERVKVLEDDRQQIQRGMVARVPIYAGVLEIQGGKNVGFQKVTRLFIEGNKPDVAIWHFKDLPVEDFVARKELPIELDFTVFRTFKGVVGQGVLAELTFKNPKTGAQIKELPFTVREYYVNRQVLKDVPGRLSLTELFQGSEGELDIEARCLSSAQYLGMSPPDLILVPQDASFGMNFAKGVFGVWLRVFLIICVAVMFSTFLSGPVAVMATVAVFVAGMFMPYLHDVATGTALGGGPTEAFERLVRQENLQRPLEPGLWREISNRFDFAFRLVLRGVTYVLPDLRTFNTAPFVANGVNIQAAVLSEDAVVALAYALPFILAGYFMLVSREIAR